MAAPRIPTALIENNGRIVGRFYRPIPEKTPNDRLYIRMPDQRGVWADINRLDGRYWLKISNTTDAARVAAVEANPDPARKEWWE